MILDFLPAPDAVDEEIRVGIHHRRLTFPLPLQLAEKVGRKSMGADDQVRFFFQKELLHLLQKEVVTDLE